MKKRILILAGGVASRMKKAAENLQNVDAKLIEQADTLTKGMISVGQDGKSLIDYELYNAHLAGFEELLLLLHPEDNFTQAYYENLMAKDKTFGLRILFATQYIAEDRVKPAGTADAVLQALQQHKEWQKGRFIILNSDNLYSVNALNLLWNCKSDNALISYGKSALEFPEERIKAFAVIRTNDEGFLENIIEKPEEEQTKAIEMKDGRVGVSMNAFVMEASQLIPCLENTPFHPVRNEKELPYAVSLLVHKIPNSVYVIPLDENVPDLTSKYDISIVQEYLEREYQNTF
ncbi:glucose-1-phosphate adenylyltransferase [Pseudarcicella hirudinis]|uniref:Glucose-1-phosphate adenylyltransferase n=1 Tax=Pseudarcicella hirudinis TaxID=1079859 RepID=A0A1I5VJN4_9BACT|nr:sugar phosphate nucleotidyltransferase [Pseudarcicella hirudinis]SFQ07517.1 glucose-1-phosphate adenylyltransferase [Pseudarcicella hirudinis]